MAAQHDGGVLPVALFAGGHAHFVVAPHKVSSTAALQTWVVNVHLNLWRAGMNVVLDFPGALHATHSLHSVLLAIAVYFPATQSWHSPPAGPKCPAAH